MEFFIENTRFIIIYISLKSLTEMNKLLDNSFEDNNKIIYLFISIIKNKHSISLCLHYIEIDYNILHILYNLLI